MYKVENLESNKIKITSNGKEMILSISNKPKDILPKIVIEMLTKANVDPADYFFCGHPIRKEFRSVVEEVYKEFEKECEKEWVEIKKSKSYQQDQDYKNHKIKMDKLMNNSFVRT